MLAQCAEPDTLLMPRVIAIRPSLVVEQIALPLADLGLFACVHSFRHEFEIGDHVVQLRFDQAGNVQGVVGLRGSGLKGHQHPAREYGRNAHQDSPAVRDFFGGEP